MFVLVSQRLWIKMGLAAGIFYKSQYLTDASSLWNENEHLQSRFSGNRTKNWTFSRGRFYCASVWSLTSSGGAVKDIVTVVSNASLRQKYNSSVHDRHNPLHFHHVSDFDPGLSETCSVVQNLVMEEQP